MGRRNNEGKHECAICNIHFSSSTSMKAHVRAKHDGDKLPCDMCNASFSDVTNLNRHKRLHKNRGNVFWWCSACQRSLGSRSDNAKRHEKSKPGCMGQVHKKDKDEVEELRESSNSSTSTPSTQPSPGTSTSSAPGQVAAITPSAAVGSFTPYEQQSEQQQHFNASYGHGQLISGGYLTNAEQQLQLFHPQPHPYQQQMALPALHSGYTATEMAAAQVGYAPAWQPQHMEQVGPMFSPLGLEFGQDAASAAPLNLGQEAQTAAPFTPAIDPTLGVGFDAGSDQLVEGTIHDPMSPDTAGWIDQFWQLEQQNQGWLENFAIL